MLLFGNIHAGHVARSMGLPVKRLVLATIDPIAGLAGTDQALLDQVLAGLASDNDALQALLTGLRSEEAAASSEAGQVDDDDILTSGFDITRTVRYRNIESNPRATLVIDDLASVDPWSPRGVKIIGAAAIEQTRRGPRFRITPDVVECISRRENMLRNSVHTRLPKPLASLVQLRGALQRQINRRAAREAQAAEPPTDPQGNPR